MKLSYRVLALAAIIILAIVFVGGIMTARWISRPYALSQNYLRFSVRMMDNHGMMNYYRQGPTGRHDRGFGMMGNNSSLERPGYGMMKGRRMIGGFDGGGMASRGRGFGMRNYWSK